MNQQKFNADLLIKLQQTSWYILLVYFGLAVIISLLHISIPFQAGYVGVLLILFLTLLKLLLMADQFRRIKLVRLTYIAILLMFIIIVTVLVRLYR